jgi:hypothetical protein
MDADGTMADLARRLVAMVENRPFRFRETRRSDAEAYLRARKEFSGYAEAEIALAEQARGCAFPGTFRAYLSRMGRARGDLFRGSDVTDLERLEESRRVAIELLASSGADPDVLSPDAVVLLVHQGYTFVCIVGSEVDAPVYQYSEGASAATRVADSFLAFLDAEVQAMERLWKAQRESGGYWVTTNGTYVTETHPARASGERPLDSSDRFTPRWALWK